MESDPVNSFFGKLADLFPQNEKHELQTLTEDSPSMTSFRSLSDNSQWWDDFVTVVQTQHPNTGESNGNRSEIQIPVMDSAPEKEKLDLDLNDTHQRDHYNEMSGTSWPNQDVTDGLADTLSHSLTKISANDSDISLDKQLEDLPVGTLDTNKIVFGDYVKKSVNMSDQEFVLTSEDKNMCECRFIQDKSENNGHGNGSDSISEFSTVQNDQINQDLLIYIPSSSTDELITYCKETNVSKGSCDEEPLMGRSSQDVFTETENLKNLTNKSFLSQFSLSLKSPTLNKNDISMQNQEDVSAFVRKMDGDLQNTADVAPDVIGASDRNIHMIDHLDNQEASINMGTSTHLEDHGLNDQKALSAPVNTLKSVEDHSEETIVGTEKNDDNENGFFSQASCNKSTAQFGNECEFVVVHSSTASQRTEIEVRQSDMDSGDLCDIISKPDSEPSTIQLEEKEKKEMQEDFQGKRLIDELDGPQEEMKGKSWKINMQDETDTPVQAGRQMDSEKPVDTSSVFESPEDSSPSEKTTEHPLASESNQTVLSPTTVKEKPLHLSFFFTGMRGTKKEAHDERDSLIQPQSPESQSNKKEVKGDFLEQITQFFNSSKGDGKRKKESTSSPPLSPISQEPAEKPEKCQTGEETVISQSEETNKAPNTETALDAFKAFFTVKPVKKETSLRMDMEAGKRKINRDKEVFRTFFDRNTIKSPEEKGTNDSKSEVNEERTPKRLQTIWPPPKLKDKEEKIGLKYTEAEHQAALLQQKREFDEEKEKIQADHKLQLFRIHEEHEVVLSKLEATIASLQRERIKDHHKDLRDVAVSTEDHIRARVFRSVCIQTDIETFIKPDEVKGTLNRNLEPNNSVSKNTDFNSTKHLNFTGKQKTLPSPPPPPALPQLELDDCKVPPPPPPPPGPFAPTVSSLYSQSLDVTRSVPQPPPPPPPPMTGCGLPPPPPPVFHSIPPPPPGGGIFLNKVPDSPHRKRSVEPVCPMKPLYWTRIQIQDNRNDMLWSSLVEPDIINTNEFAEMFAKATAPTKRKTLSEAYEKNNKAKKVIKLLDGKRSQAVGILISSLHLEMKDIQQAVLTLDNSVVDLDAIEALYENRAQPDELEKIKKHYETADEEQVKLLDKPEQFLYELSQIPEFSGRVHCFIFQSTFTDAIASIQRKAEIILSVCKHLSEEDSVKEVMGLVLAFGNYMNGGSRARGQADGYGFEILPKLKDVKSRDNRISLLDYIVSYYLHHFDKNAGSEKSIFPLPEPQDVFLASQVKFEDLSKDLRKLSRDLAVCKKDVLTVCTNSSQEHMHPFKEKMDCFIANAQKEVVAVEHQVMSARKSFLYLAEYFSLKPRSGEQEVVPSHVFTLWFEFCNDFEIRWKRENKKISNQRLKEAQQSVRNITAEKKIETRRVHANGLKERLRLKEASLTSS